MISCYQLRDVMQHYHSRTVLDVPHLNIQRGEILAIVGPSGAGKSTLLRLLGFLEKPTDGDVTVCFNKRQITYQNISTEERRQMAMVFQNSVMLSRNVRSNVAYGLNIRGQRRNREAVEAVLKKVDLAHLANVRPQTLSGGEMQRVAIARALVLNPQVLLLDEPTANLDPYNVKVIESCVLEQNKEHQTTIIMVTHNIFQARRLADRVMLLVDGKLIEIAPTNVFFDTPSDPRTAKFLSGDMIY